MSSHNSDVFKNSCFKTPINPESRLPRPSYERQSHDTYETTNSMSTGLRKSRKTKKSKIKVNKKENDSFLSLADFYESIPDYQDINHLSETDFYNRLETIKNRRKEFNKYLSSCNKKSIADSPIDEPTFRCTTPNDLRTKAVRINSGKSNKSNCTVSFRSNTPNTLDDFDYCGSATPLSTYFRSKSASPLRQNHRSLTVPDTFRMTQREEEERAYRDLMLSSKKHSAEDVRTPPITIKANPVPITSKIPMLKQIMAEQEHKSQLNKLNSAIELQSKMKPFQFSLDRSERQSSKSFPMNRRSTSTPHLCNSDGAFHTSPPLSGNDGQFKARPCPKNLFSNYFYFKMHEDEYYRNLSKKIRAEELLRTSCLPPSMSRRAAASKQQNNRAPAADDETIAFVGGVRLKRRKRTKKRIPNYDALHDRMKQRLSERHSNYITTSPTPFEFETEKRSVHRKSKLDTFQPDASRSSSVNWSPVPIYPVARPNLAATLRTEWCRRQLIAKDLQASEQQNGRLQIKSRNDWGVRRAPAWRSLYIDGTHAEDLSLRLATRIAEQKLREKEHELSMEMMRQRVRSVPLLLEGPTHWAPRSGAVHRCSSPSSKRPFSRSTRHVSQSRAMSKMSNYSVNSKAESKFDVASSDGSASQKSK